MLLDPVPNSDFFGLTLYGDYLYWTDRENLSIWTVHKNTGNGLITILENLEHLMDVQVFSRSHQQGINDTNYVW